MKKKKHNSLIQCIFKPLQSFIRSINLQHAVTEAESSSYPRHQYSSALEKLNQSQSQLTFQDLMAPFSNPACSIFICKALVTKA